MSGTVSDYQEMVEEIDKQGDELSDWERRFISGHVDDPPGFFSEKQRATIDRIYEERMT